MAGQTGKKSFSVAFKTLQTQNLYPMKIDHQVVHPYFKLNGFSLDRDDLCRLAYCFIKEGEDYEKPVGEFILDWFDDHDFIEMNTSGSTGKPKIIQVSKQAMIQSALATGKFFELEAGQKALNCLPAKYVAGKMMFVRSFVLGLDLDFVAPSLTPFYNNSTIYDFSALVPMQVMNSMEDLKYVKKVIIGGAKVNSNLEKMLSQKKTESYETYGMTETVSHIAAKRVGTKEFTVLPNVTISTDERGCLIINAPLISPDQIITNDLVEILDDNHFIFLGRIDNVINSGGIKFTPEIIEEKLANSISSRFIIGGIPDEKLGEKLILIIEGSEYDLPKNIFNQLDQYEVPKAIFFIENFIETENGKIHRKNNIAHILK